MTSKFRAFARFYARFLSRFFFSSVFHSFSFFLFPVSFYIFIVLYFLFLFPSAHDHVIATSKRKMGPKGLRRCILFIYMLFTLSIKLVNQTIFIGQWKGHET